MSQLLIMEDDRDIASLYSRVLEEKGHKVILAHTAEKCLKIYSKRLYEVRMKKSVIDDAHPFDAVILDYKMPDRNGLEVAKEIITYNSRQRIIFASAYIEDTVFNSIKKLKVPVEILRKPVSRKTLVDTIEHRQVYQQLKNRKIDPEAFRMANLSHEQLKTISDILSVGV
jgi:CheY-like chemotaxis protein